MTHIGQNQSKFTQHFITKTEQLAFVSSSGPAYWGDLLHQIEQAKRGFSSLGVKPNDCILIALKPCQELFVSLFALLELGAKALTLPTHLSREDVIRWANAASTRGAILEKEVLIQTELDLLQRQEHLFGVVKCDDPLPKEWMTFTDLLSLGGNLPDEPTLPDTTESIFVLTPGYLEAPKGLILTRKNIVSASLCFAKTLKKLALHSSGFVNFLPLSATMMTTSLGILANGGWIFFPDQTMKCSWNSSSFKQTKYFIITPNALKKIHFDPNKKKQFSHFDAGITFGTPLEIENISELNIRLFEGLTSETMSGPIAIRYAPKQQLQLLPHIETEQERITQRHTPVPIPKQIKIKGHSLCLESIKPEGQRSQTITPQGWFETGHLALLQENNLHIHCHITQVHGEGRERFFATKIEEKLCQHPQVRNAVLYKMTRPPHKLKVSVVPEPKAPGRTLTGQRVLDYLKDYLPHFMLPTFIEFRESLPRNSFGQIEYWKLI